MVESITKNKEVNTENMPQGESSSRVSSSKKHVFSKTPGVVYQSKEDLENQYIMKGNLAMHEIRDLLPEVERISRVFSSKKHVFSKTPGVVYQYKEDLANQYIVKGNLALSEIRDLLPKVERIS